MSAIKGGNTKPELILRKTLYRSGLRYRLNVRGLPGRPDLVFPKYRAVIFVHGCFWHKHDCPLFKWPKTRQEFWREKISGNVERDKRNVKNLIRDGWRVGTVWECALTGRGKLDTVVYTRKIRSWLNSDADNLEISGSFQHTSETRA